MQLNGIFDRKGINTLSYQFVSAKSLFVKPNEALMHNNHILQLVCTFVFDAFWPPALTKRIYVEIRQDI